MSVIFDDVAKSNVCLCVFLSLFETFYGNLLNVVLDFRARIRTYLFNNLEEKKI